MDEQQMVDGRFGQLQGWGVSRFLCAASVVPKGGGIE